MTVTDKQEINSPDIEAYQAMKLLESGDSPAAIKKCMEAIDKFGDNRNCYLVKARAHIESEEYGFAEEALQHVLKLDPEHPAAWAMMGEVYYRLGNETRVEYCRARLESIFPAITEPFFQKSTTSWTGLILNPTKTSWSMAFPTTQCSGTATLLCLLWRKKSVIVTRSTYQKD